MNAGRLDEIIVIQKPIVSKDEYGANITEWVDSIRTRADVQFESGNRQNENNEIVYSYSKVFTIRYYHNIDEFDRVIWKCKKYRILSIEPDKGKQSITIRTELINE